MPDRCVALRGLSMCAQLHGAAAHRAKAPRATAHRAKAPPPQRGFSLLELLVALVVVVLVTTLVNLGVSSGGQDVQLRALVNELAETGTYALDEAQMTGTDFGLLLDEEQQAGDTIYTFTWLEHHIEGWREPLSGKEVFAKQRLPAGFTLDLELEDSPLTDMAEDDKADRKVGKQGEDPKKEEDAIHPQVVFYSSGETTAGALNVRQAKGGDLLWRVEWDLLGRFKVLPRGEETDDSDKQDADR